LAALSWSAPFNEPIALPDGSQIVTLEDAAKHIQDLPKAEQDLDVWQFAVEMLINAADKGWPRMMANIAFLRALNRNVVREFKTGRKETHWGKRKLKRDE
jgi:hypothetical protein